MISHVTWTFFIYFIIVYNYFRANIKFLGHFYSFTACKSDLLNTHSKTCNLEIIITIVTSVNLKCVVIKLVENKFSLVDLSANYIEPKLILTTTLNYQYNNAWVIILNVLFIIS